LLDFPGRVAGLWYLLLTILGRCGSADASA
jgi:hypothetical protein